MNKQLIKTWMIRLFPPSIYLIGRKFVVEEKDSLNRINKMAYEPVEGCVGIRDFETHRRDVKRFFYAEPYKKQVIFEFLDAKIKIISEKFDPLQLREQDVVLFCPIKNEIYRIKPFMDYYRGIGIRHFVFIDNDSTDGTFEYLNEQNDVNLYLAEEPYSTVKREGWLNRMYSYYGYNHWFLCVDSDELFTYPGCEEYSIQEFIDKVGKGRIKTVLIDMYANKNILEKSDEFDSFEDYSFFDATTYKLKKDIQLDFIEGGPRRRLFSKPEKNFKCLLTKYSLFFYQKGDFQVSSHFMYPYYKNYGKDIYAVLRHYKFMNHDAEKYIERARDGNYAYGSMEYKTYAEQINGASDLNFCYEDSVRYENSYSLLKLKIKGLMMKNVF